MRQLLKVMLVLGLVFASTFVLGRVLGILTVENVRLWFDAAHRVDAIYVIAVVIALLFADLFVAIPTLTVTLLAGYFLGFPAGALTAFAGMNAAALGGFFLSRRWGDHGIRFLVRNPQQRLDLHSEFQRSGPAMIMLSRAMPILPEVTACMAGATGMPLSRYLVFFTVSTLPYVSIAAWAGSASSLANPAPAIAASLFLYAVLISGWFLYRRRQRCQPVE